MIMIQSKSLTNDNDSKQKLRAKLWSLQWLHNKCRWLCVNANDNNWLQENNEPQSLSFKESWFPPTNHDQVEDPKLWSLEPHLDEVLPIAP
jgi:hypothetical protein